MKQPTCDPSVLAADIERLQALAKATTETIKSMGEVIKDIDLRVGRIERVVVVIVIIFVADVVLRWLA